VVVVNEPILMYLDENLPSARHAGLVWKEVMLGKTHLADLCQGHGDAVELVLIGTGNQGFL
jgi:hypothetical protein